MLSSECQARLEEIGVVFGEKTELIFNANLEKLKEYLEEYGEFPVSSVIYKDYKLGLWCARQRECFAKGKLQDFQIESLKAINFDLRTNGEIRKANEFKKGYKAYIDFVNINKKKPTAVTNQKLYNWYSKSIKRAELDSLDDDMIAKLEIIKEL